MLVWFHFILLHRSEPSFSSGEMPFRQLDASANASRTGTAEIFELS
jgi:hypothetical protein